MSMFGEAIDAASVGFGAECCAGGAFGEGDGRVGYNGAARIRDCTLNAAFSGYLCAEHASGQ
jgi:hypothetical protein